MTESREEVEKRHLRELEGKNIAHYSVLLGAWIETRMERDKTLVTLSAAAIALLVIILTTVGARHIWEIPLFATAVLAFLVTIWISLTIYQLNSQHLEAAIKGSSTRDPRLEKYDKLSGRAFMVGATTALLIGISSATSQFMSEESRTMSEQKPSDRSGRPTTHKEDVNQAINRRPVGEDAGRRSLDGITNLKPRPAEEITEATLPEQSQSSGTPLGSSSTSSDSGQK